MVKWLENKMRFGGGFLLPISCVFLEGREWREKEDGTSRNNNPDSPEERLLSGRRKKALFVSPSPDTASKGAKGIYETRKKCRAEKTGEISRNLPFSRFFLARI